MKPQYSEKSPIKKNKYLTGAIAAARVPFSLFDAIRYAPKIVSKAPCMISPNMTPNKKGNETMAGTAGLNSL